MKKLLFVFAMIAYFTSYAQNKFLGGYKHLIMSLCLLMILFIGIACQEEKIQNVEKTQEEMKEVKMVALNVCADTEDADILLLCADGSYMICNAENQKGYSVLYMNDSINNDFEKGLTVFLDENGTPVMATSSKGTFVFKNVTDARFHIHSGNGNTYDFYSVQVHPATAL